MEVLGATLLAELAIGVIILGVRYRNRARDPRASEVLNAADQSMLGIAAVRSDEPLQSPQFRRSCGCKSIGCTM